MYEEVAYEMGCKFKSLRTYDLKKKLVSICLHIMLGLFTTS